MDWASESLVGQVSLGGESGGESSSESGKVLRLDPKTIRKFRNSLSILFQWSSLKSDAAASSPDASGEDKLERITRRILQRGRALYKFWFTTEPNGAHLQRFTAKSPPHLLDFATHFVTDFVTDFAADFAFGFQTEKQNTKLTSMH